MTRAETYNSCVGLKLSGIVRLQINPEFYRMDSLWIILNENVNHGVLTKQCILSVHCSEKSG